MAIKSNQQTAKDVQSKFQNIDLGTLNSSKLEFTQSNIGSMKKGKTLANQMLGDLAKLAKCLNNQSSKFHDIAKIISEHDKNEAKKFKGK